MKRSGTVLPPPEDDVHISSTTFSDKSTSRSSISVSSHFQECAAIILAVNCHGFAVCAEILLFFISLSRTKLMDLEIAPAIHFPA